MTTEKSNPDEEISAQNQSDGEEKLDVRKWIDERERILTNGIWPEIVNLPEGTAPFQIKDGDILIDEQRLNKEREEVNKALALSIENGDEVVFDRLTRGLSFAEDEEHTELYVRLQRAFKAKNSGKLKSINVDLLTDGIAQRNIIREALRPQVAKLPFSFVDRDGKKLDPEQDLDIVFVKDKENGFKLIVGAKRGVEEIEISDKLGSDKYQPDFLNIDKDQVTDAITIPLKPAKNKQESYVVSVEIRKGPIDLPQKLAKEEALEQAKRAQKRRERATSSYSPPAASSPRRSSESGGYGYSRVSG